MARLNYPDPEQLHPKVRAVLDSLPGNLNIFRMSALAERNFEPLMRLGGTILNRQELSGQLRELAILRVARLSGAEYEWGQHVPIARSTGCTTEQISALEDGETNRNCFNQPERAVLDFTDEVVRSVRPSDSTLEALQQYLSEREVLELTIAVGFYMLMARIMEVSGIELEAPVGESLLEETPRP